MVLVFHKVFWTLEIKMVYGLIAPTPKFQILDMGCGYFILLPIIIIITIPDFCMFDGDLPNYPIGPMLEFWYIHVSYISSLKNMLIALEFPPLNMGLKENIILCKCAFQLFYPNQRLEDK